MTNPLLTPGFWCECYTSSITRPARRIAATRVDTPDQAIYWIRTGLEAVIPALGGDTHEKAQPWLTEGHITSAQALTEGTPIDVILLRAGITIAYTIRPTPFLTLTNHQPE
ncbi:hypothetical protein ACFVIM_04285 [Streptomyces sp. NPDC057638]|uniref:hypothetical protein n=1 Tax=Streptomyces sp. NPDC057638 TaxID=3346190 RepID=UPI0036C7D535